VGGAEDEDSSGDLMQLPFPEAKTRVVERFEVNYLKYVLQQYGNVSAAARAAGLDRSNFRRLLRRHEITAN
jgi:two-component system response regulator HydG